MPELPEVETIARALHRRLRGLRLGNVDILRQDVVHGDPRPLSVLLHRRCVEAVRRNGKRVIVELRPRATLIFHLGMSGRLTLTRRDQAVAKHTHVRIALHGLNEELRFQDARRFGGVWCLTGSQRGPQGGAADPSCRTAADDRRADHGRLVGRTLGPLGLEPLEMSEPAFRGALQRRRQIKALLLDQRVIAGLGNIYCDEALHAARIHPRTSARRLEAKQVGLLLRAIRSTLNRAIRFKGSTLMDYRQADGTAGSFQKHHRVYQREGKPCRRCAAPIERIIVAGRSTFLCPICQRTTA